MPKARTGKSPSKRTVGASSDKGSRKTNPQDKQDAGNIGESKERTDTSETNEADASDDFRAIFTCPGKGFVMGENLRFKQRAFIFDNRPDDTVIARLKDHGFAYRPAPEKAWTIPASAASRLLTDRLALEFAGDEIDMTRG